MRRVVICVLALAAASLGAFAAFRVLGTPAGSDTNLVSLIPPGALLVLEAKDLSSLVNDWNGSKEKQQWLTSDNYQTFSRSRLFLRLDQSRQEFESAAGVPPDSAFLSAVAGTDSALALYDIGKLEFVYVTRMPIARTAATTFWQKRGDFQTRSVGDQTYYLKTNPGSQRTVAFAASQELLLLASREDLISSALKRASTDRSDAQSSIESEHWFGEATQAANDRAPRGDLRLVFNLAGLVRSPYFRSYWIQRNVNDLRAFDSAVCDLYRSADEIREERIFFRTETAASALPQEAQDQVNSIGNLLALVPADAGFYRGWTRPSNTEIVTALTEKVLAPRPNQALPGNQAPAVTLTGGESAGAGDFETRIDQEPPASTDSSLNAKPIETLLGRAQPNAILEVESSQSDTGNVLPENRSAIVLTSAKRWDRAETRTAIQSAVESLWTTSRLGLQWIQRSNGGVRFDALDGLAPIETATRDNLWVVANDTKLISEIIRQPSRYTELSSAQYAAGLRLDLERGPFNTMTRLIDTTIAPPGAPREPAFFSGNIASLARTTDRVQSASIILRDTGKTIRQTVKYRLGESRTIP